VTQCVCCGKYLCSECIFIKEEQDYCKDCVGKREYPVGTGKLIFPPIVCGIVAGLLSTFLSLFFCLWIVGAGALAVFMVKRISHAKKIPMETAAFAGGLSGAVASLVMWIIFQIGTIGFMLEMLLILMMIPFFDVSFLWRTGIRTLLFVFLSTLGGIIFNELTK
jgi:hypothetical protein